MSKQKQANPKVNKLIMYLLAGTVVLMTGMLIYIFTAPKHTNQQPKQPEQATSQTEKNGYDAYAGIKKDDIDSRGQLWEVAFYPEQIPIAALVHIDSIDGGRNYSPIYEKYVLSQTYGKMTVLEVYKGDVHPGQKLVYSRYGGIITAQEYLNALNTPGIEETYLHGGRPSEKKFVKEYIVDDIDVEVGKTYLAYMAPESSKNGKYLEYSISGVQFGFREVRGSGDNISVLNNGTKDWESLNVVVKLK